MALFVLDLPSGHAGNLKVAALDHRDPDSTEVIESGTVTFNGGVVTPFPPVILRTTTVHNSTEYRVDAVGAGLAAARGISLVAVDGSWQQPLTIASNSDHTLTATAQLAANVPPCFVEIAGADTSAAVALLQGDPPPPLLGLFDTPEGCETRMREVWPDHDPYLIQPKDFTLVPGGWTPDGTWTFHVFYIRQNQYLNAAATTNNIGHAVSDTLSGWTIADTAAIKARTGRFDSQHVWAPHIVRRGVTYHMFYTGVDGSGTQRIGLATSTDLMNWSQEDSILEVSSISWADPSPDSLYGGAPQLRDPFVMEDPANPGDWLMYFVTVADEFSPEMVVGVARSSGDFETWGEVLPLWHTHHSWPNQLNDPPTAYVIESPHAFERNGSWWLFSTVNGDSVWATANASIPSDTTTANWTQGQKLWTLVPALQAPNLYYWHATEYLQISEINDIEYLAAFNDANVCISFTQMRPTSVPYLFSMGCPDVTDVGPSVASREGSGVLLAGAALGGSRVRLRLELPSRMQARLVIYDVMGRRVKTVVDGLLPGGMTEHWWDGKDVAGVRVASGVYFAGLTAAGRTHSVRIPLFR
jgi:hypothetical protein